MSSFTIKFVEKNLGLFGILIVSLVSIFVQINCTRYQQLLASRIFSNVSTRKFLRRVAWHVDRLNAPVSAGKVYRGVHIPVLS